MHWMVIQTGTNDFETAPADLKYLEKQQSWHLFLFLKGYNYSFRGTIEWYKQIQIMLNHSVWKMLIRRWWYFFNFLIISTFWDTKRR